MASHTGTIICILISVNFFMDVTDLSQSYLIKQKVTDCEATKCWAVIPVGSQYSKKHLWNVRVWHFEF